MVWVFSAPPPSTPNACIGVPGRPYVMICSTSSGEKRNSSVLSAGAFQTNDSGGWGPSGPSGSITAVVEPPPPSLPWQFAHWSESTEL